MSTSKLVPFLAAAGVLLAGCGSLTATADAGPTSASTGGTFPSAQVPVAGTTSATPTRTTRRTSPPAPTTPTSKASSTPGISADAAAQRLRDKTAGSDVSVVLTAAGYQAMAWDQRGDVTFYLYTDAAGWKGIGQSTYPNLPPPDASHPDAAQGAVLAHMTNATFILNGLFSGDGTGNAIAFTADANGRWGAIKAKSNGDIGPSGQPVNPNDNIGVEQAFYLVNGQLESAECSDTLISADCSGDQRVFKYWEWNGTDFALVRRAGLSH